MRVSRRSRFSLAAVLTASLALSACGEKPPQGAPGMPGGEMPPAEVGVVTVTKGAVALTNELPGRLEAVRSSEVRARVAGIVLKRSFQEGSDVRAGDVLFQIDPAQYSAALSSAKANLARAEATLSDARLRANRAEQLIGSNMISRQDYDTTQANAKAAAAEVAAAKASVDAANLNLGYATVRAPISGRVGRALVTEGALVGQGEVTPLALVQQIDKLYVNFTQSATEVLQLKQAMNDGSLRSSGGTVSIVMEDGSVYPHQGKLLFSDLSVDAGTGAITLRAEVPNPEKLLLPGMYVRVRVEQGVQEQAITIPQRGLQRGAQGAAVMLVKDGKVAVQPVQVGNAEGDRWIITDGLVGGEQLIVEGLQKIQPGAPVVAVPFGAEAAKPQAPAAPQAAK